MGKPTGFLEYNRQGSNEIKPLDRIKNYDEFHTPLSDEERRQQGARCMNCGVPFCQSGMQIEGMLSGCPLGNLIPEWNDLVYRGNMSLALMRLLKTNCFPEFTSRVCPAPCEFACTCGLDSAPVTIKENENAVIEYGFANGLMKDCPPESRTDKRVAVVGSGPAGLAAAQWLCRRGHDVTVFEKSDAPGGLLMYGIPNMKLDKKIVNRRIELMKSEGIEFKTSVEVGKDIAFTDLENEYDAIVLACGTTKPRDIAVNGRGSLGIFFAVDYLTHSTKSVISGKKLDTLYDAKGKDVVVIGGGDTGNDCVGTAVRQGAASITQLEMMPPLPKTRPANQPWPIWPRVLKTDYGQEEAIAVYGNDPRIYKTTVKSFEEKDGKVSAVNTISLESLIENGRMTMKEVPGSEKKLSAQLVLIAAGFAGTDSALAEKLGVSLDGRNNVVTDSLGSHLVQGTEKVFAAGDMRQGQSLVVKAIREGRDVAKEIDKFLMGYTNLK